MRINTKLLLFSSAAVNLFSFLANGRLQCNLLTVIICDLINRIALAQNA